MRVQTGGRSGLNHRWLIILVSVAVVSVGVASYYAYQKLPLLGRVDTTYSTDATPSVYLVSESEVNIVPRASTASAVHTFVIDNVQVSVPNDLVLETRISGDSEATVIVGPGEKMLVLAPVEGHGEMVKKYQSENSLFFDQRDLRSSYDFTLATMQSTPSGLSVLTSWDSLVGAAVLLSFKLSEINEASAIRPISIGSLKAVQVGGPDKGDKVVRVFLFPS